MIPIGDKVIGTANTVVICYLNTEMTEMLSEVSENKMNCCSHSSLYGG